jgi:hypothetical protein
MKPKHLLPAVAVLAVTPVAVALASTDRARTSAARSVHVTLERTAVKISDVAPAGESPGDVGLISGKLLAPATKRTVGHYQGYCIQVAPATGNSECTFTLKLPAGQITVLGGYGKGINTEQVVHEAVIGGTGAYDAARGQTTGRETGRTTEDMRITLR